MAMAMTQAKQSFNQSNHSKNTLLLCELHHPLIHGDSSARNNYLVYSRYNPFTKRIIDTNEQNQQNYIDTNDELSVNTDVDYTNEDDFDEEDAEYYANISSTIYGTAEWLNWQHKLSGVSGHPTIRAYDKLVHCNYIRPEIGAVEMLPTGEMVAVLNTFWLRVFQRRVKKYLNRKLLRN